MTIYRSIALGIGASLLGAGLAASGASAQATLAKVKERGELICGANTSLAGFGSPDEKGVWTGLDVDYCRAIAAAIFDNPNKVQFKPLNAAQRPTTISSGEVDVLIRNTTWTLGRDTAWGVNFAAVNYFDGQGFMVRKSDNITNAKELDKATVCVQQGTTTEQNLADFFRANKLTYKPVVYQSADDTRGAYEAKRCNAFTTDVSGLYAEKLKLSAPDDHVVLKEVISKEPLGSAVRHGDDQWFDIVKWVHFAMVNAEELEITKANIGDMMKSTNPEIKRFVGTEGKFGEGMGLPNDWAARVIKHVGNYGEVFEKNLGSGSRLKIERGLNGLWSKGGIMYAPPIR